MAHSRSDMTKRLISKILLCLMPLLCLPIQAAYITDKIVVEVHSERLSQGVVLKTLPSGSSVEVLMQDGDYSRIRTSDNITGWLESKYLTNEQPTQIEYLTILTKAKTLEAKLKAAEAKLANPGEGGGDGIDLAEIEELRKRAADAGWLRVELKKAREMATELENKIKSSGNTASDSREELETLRNQNKELEKRLTASMMIDEQQGSAMQEGDLSTMTTPRDTVEEGLSVDIEWFFGSIVVALIIGLIGGMTWLDKRMRQRHGGFRLY